MSIIVSNTAFAHRLETMNITSGSPAKEKSEANHVNALGQILPLAQPNVSCRRWHYVIDDTKFIIDSIIGAYLS